ncbi:putative calcium-binding protein CML18 [Curcuma longa]|uniref:putative calcium-binding protein CML18 n=1 Tax=Curcuma longa TaxID=136217 RepID=UPI003D9F875D
MKLSVDSLLVSFKCNSKNKEQRRKKKNDNSNRSTSFASVSSSSSSSQDLADQAPAATPTSVLLRPSRPPPSLSLRDLFRVFDLDGDGKITQPELEACLHRLVLDPPSSDEVARMVADVDRDGDGCISLDEFAALEAAAGLRLAGAGSELRDAFAVFDADGDGKISAEELLGVLGALGDGECTLEDCRSMIGDVDADGDGFVGFEDFVRMMDGQ